VFDTAGNLVGVLSSTSAEKSHDGIFSGEIFNARVELFHKNWEGLTSDAPVEVVDIEVLKKHLAGANQTDVGTEGFQLATLLRHVGR
jgi:hypothetical protein